MSNYKDIIIVVFCDIAGYMGGAYRMAEEHNSGHVSVGCVKRASVRSEALDGYSSAAVRAHRVLHGH